jgi:hypothetical protein
MSHESKAFEGALRRRARRLGYLVKKSRRGICSDDFGGFALLCARTNVIFWGSRFDLSCEDVRAFLDARAFAPSITRVTGDSEPELYAPDA